MITVHTNVVPAALPSTKPSTSKVKKAQAVIASLGLVTVAVGARAEKHKCLDTKTSGMLKFIGESALLASALPSVYNVLLNDGELFKKVASSVTANVPAL